LNGRLAQRGRRGASVPLHPLSDATANACLLNYDQRTKASFDRIVPVLKRLSALQHEPDFVAQAQQLAQAELGYALPLPILEAAWVTQLDMRTLFAWCVFEAYGQTSHSFFGSDPSAATRAARPLKRSTASCSSVVFIFSISPPAPTVAWPMPSAMP
jgi:hypothetical protein